MQQVQDGTRRIKRFLAAFLEVVVSIVGAAFLTAAALGGFWYFLEVLTR